MQPGALALSQALSPAWSLLPSFALGSWLYRRYTTQSNDAAIQRCCCLRQPHEAPPLLCNIGCKPQYSNRVFEQVAHFFPDRHCRPPSCIAIHSGCTDGATVAKQLQGSGFGVVSLALREQLLQAGTLQSGPMHGRWCLEELDVGKEGQQTAASQVPAVSSMASMQEPADVLVFADTLHLMDTRRALQAASRHLSRDGLLMCLWTDRSLASRFVLDVEELLESAVPGFCRYDCQRDPADWVSRLQIGGLFRLIDYTCEPHTLTLSPAALLDALASEAALHSALGSSHRRAFHHRLQQVIEKHYGAQQEIQLPLHTKAYLLAKLPSAPAAAAAPARARGYSQLQAGKAALAAADACLFCGAQPGQG